MDGFFGPGSLGDGFIVPPIAAAATFLLLENGSYLLLEDGTSKLKLESSN